MTIDEVIEDLIYDAQCNRADLDIEWAERNEQLAKWLEELKEARKWFEENRKAGISMDIQMATTRLLMIVKHI